MKPINIILAACLISAVFPQWVIILAAVLFIWQWSAKKSIQLYEFGRNPWNDVSDKFLLKILGPLGFIIVIPFSTREGVKGVFGDKFSRFAIRNPFYFKDSLDSE